MSHSFACPRRRRSLQSLGLALALIQTLSLWATDFHCDAVNGNDDHSGTAEQPWRSLARANSARLQPGDRLLFRGGQTFVGNLRIEAADAGTVEQPVVIGSYGEGRATLEAGDGTGVLVENAGGIRLENLVVIGSGPARNQGSGVSFQNRRADAARLKSVRIENVEARGFGRHGIVFYGERAGFEQVRLLRCVASTNRDGGIELTGGLPWDSPEYVHADVEVRDCQAFDNTGNPDFLGNHSGSGIVVYQVDGALIEHCVAHHNGVRCRSPAGGPVGIWTCASRRVVIQHCESYANQTGAMDGGGFDIDGGSTECVLQYNFSHDNDGTGFMVYTYAQASHTDRDNVVRFNFSVRDAKKAPGHGGILVGNHGASEHNLLVCHNTVIAGSNSLAAVSTMGRNLEVHFHNNIFVSEGEAPLVAIEQPEAGVRFEQNLYWRNGQPFLALWDKRRIHSLEDWRSLGQEQRDGQPLGLFADPLLNGVLRATNAPNVAGSATVLAYCPGPGSPASKGGLNLRELYGPRAGERDWLGRALAPTGPFPLGAAAEAPAGNPATGSAIQSEETKSR